MPENPHKRRTDEAIPPGCVGRSRHVDRRVRGARHGHHHDDVAQSNDFDNAHPHSDTYADAHPDTDSDADGDPHADSDAEGEADNGVPDARAADAAEDDPPANADQDHGPAETDQVGTASNPAGGSPRLVLLA